MKNSGKYLSVLVGLVVVFGLFFFAANRKKGQERGMGKVDIQQVIKEGFAKGDVAVIAPYFAEEMSVSLLEEGDIYGPGKARDLLNEFFNNNPVDNFTVKHSGSNISGTEQYLIGVLLTKGGKKFSVYVSSKKDRIMSIEIALEEQPISNNQKNK